jgi:hypothetical protein
MSENEEEDDISAILRFLSVIAMVVGVGRFTPTLGR